jgi:hypothetical protein
MNDSQTPSAAARELEANEAAAYRSLFAVAASLHGRHAFEVTDIGGAMALRAPLVPGSGMFNRVLGLGLDEPVSESTLDALIELYESQGLALALELVPMARTPELKALLRARRIRAGAQTAVLQRRLPAPTLDAGTLRAAPASPADQQTVADICASVFEMPPPIREVLAALGSTPGWTPWLAWLDDKPVAAALAYREGDRCWLGWDATLPPYRGRGAKGALDRARVNDMRLKLSTTIAAARSRRGAGSSVPRPMSTRRSAPILRSGASAASASNSPTNGPPAFACEAPECPRQRQPPAFPIRPPAPRWS